MTETFLNKKIFCIELYILG